MDSQSMPSNSNAFVDDLFLDDDALDEADGGAAGVAEEGTCRGKVPDKAGGRGIVFPSTGTGSSRTMAM